MGECLRNLFCQHCLATFSSVEKKHDALSHRSQVALSKSIRPMLFMTITRSNFMQTKIMMGIALYIE